MNERLDAYYRLLKKAIGDKSVAMELKNLYRDMGNCWYLKPFMFDEKKYPALPSPEAFSVEKIDRLIEKNGCLKEDVFEEITNSPIAQILYALAWKNGDLCKLGSLIQGMKTPTGAIPRSENNRYVFYQFGRHIVDRTNPIIDQHTIRAMLYYLKLFDQEMLDEKYRNIKTIFKFETPTKELAEQYLDWMNGLINRDSGEREEIHGYLDKIVFSLGKSIKARKVFKKDHAREIFYESGANNKEDMIELFCKECRIKKATAQTYYRDIKLESES